MARYCSPACRYCALPIKAGDHIVWFKGEKPAHFACFSQVEAETVRAIAGNKPKVPSLGKGATDFRTIDKHQRLARWHEAHDNEAYG